jgi:mxaL protein
MDRILRRHIILLASAVLLLLVATLRPTVPVQRDIYSYLLVADISQSMNTLDMSVNSKPASRIAYTRKMLHDLIANMPCGTRVGMAFFAGASVALQYSPIEVCENYAAIQDNIARMDWRMAWSGNSRLRQGARSIAHLTRTLHEPSQVLFFTDGEEAPRLHAYNTLDLNGFQGGKGWLVIGIGSDKGTPIPKYDETNKLLGYWSAESFQMQPGVAQISQENFGARDDGVAMMDSSRQLSRLDEPYLQKYTAEIGADYVRGDSFPQVMATVQQRNPSRHDIAPMQINVWLAALAAILLLATFFSRTWFAMPGGRFKHLVGHHG